MATARQRRELTAAVEKAGARVLAFTENKHICVLAERDGVKRKFFYPVSASDHRALKNFTSTVRRTFEDLT